jgi:hypothetical protein
VLAARECRGQIGFVSVIAGAPRAPYALEAIAFPFPALATMSGRAPLGGPREIALACFLVGRMVIDAVRGGILTPEEARTRATDASQWLASAAIPTAIRSALAKLAESTAGGDARALAAALDSVMTVTANHLDPGARLELGRLAQAIEK